MIALVPVKCDKCEFCYEIRVDGELHKPSILTYISEYECPNCGRIWGNMEEAETPVRFTGRG